MRSPRRILHSILLTGWALAALAVVSVMVTPPGPAFALSSLCETYYSGTKCGEAEECTDYRVTQIGLSAGSSGGGITYVMECSKWVTMDLYAYSSNDVFGTCSACHESSDGGDSGGGTADPGYEEWCSDPERAASTPEKCDGDPMTT